MQRLLLLVWWWILAIMPVGSCILGSSSWPPPTDYLSGCAGGVFVALNYPFARSESEVYSSFAGNFASQNVYARPSRWPPPAQMFLFSVKSTVNSQRIQRSLYDAPTLNMEVIEMAYQEYLSASAIPIVACYLLCGGVVVPKYGNYVLMCVNAATTCVNPSFRHTLFCGLMDSLKVYSRAPTSATFVISVALFSCGYITYFYCCWLLVELILPICGIIVVHFIVYFDSGLSHTTPSSFQTCSKVISCPYYLNCPRVGHHYYAYYEEFRAPNWIFPYVMVLRTALVPRDYSLGCSFYILTLDNSIISKLSCSPSGFVFMPHGLAACEDANTILLEDLTRKHDSKTQVFLAFIPKGTFSNVALHIGLYVVKVRLMVVH